MEGMREPTRNEWRDWTRGIRDQLPPQRQYCFTIPQGIERAKVTVLIGAGGGSYTPGNCGALTIVAKGGAAGGGSCGEDGSAGEDGSVMFMEWPKKPPE